MAKTAPSSNVAGISPSSTEVERLAKKARKKERKAARLTKAQKQEGLSGATVEQQTKKKRKRSNSDADIQSLLVPSQPSIAPSQKRKKTALAAEAANEPSEELTAVDSSRKKKKHKHIKEDQPAATTSTAPTATTEERKKRKREKRRSGAAATAAVELEVVAPTKETVATSDAEEPSRKKSKKAKKQATVQSSAVDFLPTSDAFPAFAVESDAARKARKAEKKARKERKRLAAEAAARVTVEPVEPQQPKASTSKLAEPPRRTSFAEDDVDAIFAAAAGPPRKAFLLTLGRAGAPAPKSSTSKSTTTDKSKEKGKGKEKSMEKSKGNKTAEESDEEDAEAFRKLCRDDIAMALSSRWLPLKQLKEIAAEHNYKYRQGKFTFTEDKIIKDTLEDYRLMHGLSHAGLKECILRDRKGKTKEDKHLLGDDLWPTVAMAVGGGRPVLSVYNHVKRQHDPHVKAGPWSMAEDAALEAAVKEHGTQWGKVGADVARNPTDCRDRYTKQLKPAVTGKRKRGKWEHAEEEKLRGLVKVHGNAWKTIEKLMDGRTATQCRTKWCDSLAPNLAIKTQFEDDEEKPAPARRWTTADRSTLVHVVADLKVKDRSEIDWEDLGDANLEQHGSTNLRNRWRQLRTKAEKDLGGAEDSPEVTHAQVVAYLLQCYPVRGSSAKARKPESTKTVKKKAASQIKSAKFIESSSEEDEGASGSEDEDSD